MESGENQFLPYIIGRDPFDESDLLFPKRYATKAIQVDGNNVELQLRVFSSGLCFLYRGVQFVLVNTGCNSPQCYFRLCNLGQHKCESVLGIATYVSPVVMKN